MRKKRKGILLVTPALVGFGIFYFIPFLITIWYSVSFGIGKREFVGLENFRDILQNEMFLLALKNTGRFLCVSVPVVLVLSFSMAWMLGKMTGGCRTLGMIYFYPLMIPIASVIMTVKLIWGDLGALGGKSFWVLCVLYWWKFTGYHVLIFLARIQMIPKPYYEYAKMEGAGGWNLFRYVVFPSVLPVTGLNALLAVMNAFKCYREAFLIGGNYPDDSIYLLQHFMNNNFANLNYQKISSASVLLMVGMLVTAMAGYGVWCGRKRRKQEG